MEQSFKSSVIPCRRFGRTGIEMPLLSLGGMRFQQSWKDIDAREITSKNQHRLEKIISETSSLGLHHIETARHYGSSERQLGWALKKIPDSKRILQTKVPPRDDSKEFEAELELCFQRMDCKKIDLLSIHGINLPEHLQQTLRSGGCLDVVRRWQKKGFIGHIGFSTHATSDLIVKAIETDQFDYVNLHWYFIRQQNSLALDAALKFDLGVFIISPTDKGGHLHSPSKKLLELCAPIHPIVFNDLFCLRDKRVHTISVGISETKDLKFHLDAIGLLGKTNEFLPIIQNRFMEAAYSALGKEWLASWDQGLPDWQNTPGEINIPILLWLSNLVDAWGMEGFAKARYRLLGSAGHWFPGSNADCLDEEVSEETLKSVLGNSPWRNEIPEVLRSLRNRCAGEIGKRLSDT
tara:strand:- start:3140 stop:4360 length:1221 start_codon:yes stop_codon:yes gene_type:complete